MEDLESLIDSATERLQHSLFEVNSVIPEHVVSNPLEFEFYKKELFTENLSFDLDLPLPRIELVVKKILNELIASFDSSLPKICVLLDFCYHSKFTDDEDRTKAWAALFFDLTSICLLSIPFPDDLLHFYPYLDSRLSWYLEGTSKEIVPHGQTNLKMGIRPPAAKLFFSVDAFFKNLNSYSILNSPKHFELLHKLLWWISQLIPIDDNCNINRRAKIMDSYPESLWSPSLPSLPSSPTILSDWIKICDELFLHPLHWLFSHPRDKAACEPLVDRFVNEVLIHEEEYFNMIKRKNEKNAREQAAINGEEYYSLNFIQSTYYNEPKDTRASITASKIGFWKKFTMNLEKTEDIVQLLPLEIDLFDLKAFQDNIEAYEFNYFRKFVLLQIYITFYLLKEIICRESLNQYYSRIFSQSASKKSANLRLEFGDNKLNKNEAVIKFLEKILSRISLFYEERDKNFQTVIVTVSNAELNTLEQKVHDFSNLREVNWSTDPIEKPTFNESFKKFGWIKLGNKNLDSVWKIQSGLDLVQKFSESNRKNPEELYNFLSSSHGTAVETETETETETQTYNNSQDGTSITEQKIVKQWQTLRSLRSKYLFEFGKVNENTTLNGFSNEELIKKDLQLKERKLKTIIDRRKASHLKNYQEAEQFFKDKESKKKAALAEKIKSQREALESAKADREKERSNPLTDTNRKRDHDSEEQQNEDTTVKKRKVSELECNDMSDDSTTKPNENDNQDAATYTTKDSELTVQKYPTTEVAPAVSNETQNLAEMPKGNKTPEESNSEQSQTETTELQGK